MSAESIATRQRELNTARRRALAALAEVHHGEYQVLLNVECRAMGIDPPGSRPVGRPSHDSSQ